MKITKRKLLIICIAVAAITLAIIVFYSSKKNVQTSTPVAITDSTPNENASKVSVFDPITITFNQKIDASTILIVSNPTENWTASQNSPNSIKIDHKLYLKVATVYKLTVLQNGNTIGDLTFETSHDQNDPRQIQNLQSTLETDYPLASLTPYETTRYRVVYSAPLTLEIYLKDSITAQDAISEVQSWVKSNGIDPATHKYIVTTTSPTP